MEIQTGDGKNGLQSLEVDEIRVITEMEHELSEECFPKADKQQSSCVLASEESEAEGQVVPCQNTHSKEVLYEEGTNKDDCLTVPLIGIDGKPVERLEKQNELAEDNLKEDNQQGQQFTKIFNNNKEELCVNKFQWPALGISDETAKNVITKPDMFQQFLLGKNDERCTSESSTSCPSLEPTTTSSDIEPINTTAVLKDESLRPGAPKIQLSSIFKREAELTRSKETAIHFPDGMGNIEPLLVNTTVALEDSREDLPEKPKLPSILKEDLEAARGKETAVRFRDDVNNMESMNTTVALEDEDLSDEPKMQLLSVLKKDTKVAICTETAVHSFPENMSNIENVNTTVALPLKDEDFPEEPKLSSILKRDTQAARCKETIVHFPEDIVSVRFYDISDDDDSDADTVILSDTEENLPTDQQVPSNTFSGSIDNDYCIPNRSFLSYKCGDFKPQFSFPPAIKISNYQLFDNLDDEEQMIEEMEIGIDNELDVVNVESQDEENGYHDDQSTGIGKTAIRKNPVILEFTDFKEHAAVGNVALPESQDETYEFYNGQSKTVEKKAIVEDPVIEFAHFKEHDAVGTELTESQEGTHELYNDQSIEKKAVGKDLAVEVALCKVDHVVGTVAGVTGFTESQGEIDRSDKGQCSSTEKLTIGGQAAGFAHCMERVAESHADGISEDSSVLDNCAKKCDHMETSIESCSDNKGILCGNEVQEHSWTPNDPKTADATLGLEDIEHKEIKDSRIQSSSIITSVPDQTPFLGRCGSRFLRRRPVSMNTLLINEDLSLSTFKESMRPGKILQTVREEDMVFYDERIIDVVTHETNILNLSQEEVNCVHGQPQCHEKPEKAVISSLASSPDHFNTLDATWESSFDLSTRNNKWEKSIVKSTIKAERSSENNNQFTAVGDLRCDRIRTGEEADYYEDQKQQVSISTAASITPDQHIWARCPEIYAVPVYQTRPNTDPHCHVPLYSMMSSKPTQKRSPQIVPEIEARESKISRKHLPAYSNSTSLHAVPSELDDVMDFDASFHSDDHSFPQRKTLGGCDATSKVNENHTNKEERKPVSQISVFTPTSASHTSETAVFLTRQGRNRLRVGLSKSTRVKPLHPYWSKSRIK